MATYYVEYRKDQNKLIKRRISDASAYAGVCVIEDDELYVISIDNVVRSKGKIKNCDKQVGLACYAYIEDQMRHHAVQAGYRHAQIRWDASSNEHFVIYKPDVRPTDNDLDVCEEAFTNWFSARIENAPAAPTTPNDPDDPDDPDAPSDPNAPTNPPAPAQPEKTVKERRAEALDLLGTSDFNAEALLDTYELGYDPDDGEEEDDEDDEDE